MSGGLGSRLWPLSHAGTPKQFLSLFGEKSLFRSTIDRASLLSDVPPMILTGTRHDDLVTEEAPPDAVIVFEPAPRNTAPAIIAAALVSHPEDILVILPADHLISDTDSFVESMHLAVRIAEKGGIVTLGVVPTRAETGYGWIKMGTAGEDGGFTIDTFVEKPSEDVATAMLDDGDYLWNSGVFIARASQVIAAAEEFSPETLISVQASVPANPSARVFLGDQFLQAPANSFDRAVMERVANGFVVPLDAGWSDVGSWLSVWENLNRDSSGNATRGTVVTVDSANSLVWSSGRPIAVVGVEGIVVVETEEGILVAAMESGQQIRSVVEQLDKISGEGE